jgi:D-lactate dehydrogenase
MKIQYFSGETWEEAFVRAKLPSEDIVFHEGSVAANTELTDPAATVLCTFIESHIGEEEMKRFPSLKLIATRSTGYDHIDLEAAKARGIAVANVPSYGEHTVAEFAFALILALSRRIIDADESVRATGTFSSKGLRGFDLSGKTIGVVGCGHIGLHVIKMANGFDMKVLGFDVHPDPELARTLNFTYAALPELLATADIITLHVPYNTHTHHLISRENIGGIKKGAYLVNTSRGAVVETNALVEALQKGILAGAALDVLEEEGELADEMLFLTTAHPQEEGLKIALENHYLISHPRVIVTPHVAFDTKEAIERILDTTIENIERFEAGAPANIVT